MTNEEIEQVAYDLQCRIWREQHLLRPGGSPSLIEMLNPSAAARLLGIEYEVYEELGVHSHTAVCDMKRPG
ncbi:MAG: hypothetical protein JWN13_5078 [Betaproteobacteria bacterium]|jgi:hypothetical protein|nr:hypothetical protein [Betaproteobacteria bacterium]